MGRTRTWRRVALLIGALVLVAGLVLAVQAWRATTALREVRQDLNALQAEAAADDLGALHKTADRLSLHARSARSATDGWLWEAATRLPVLGVNAEAVQVYSRTLDELSHGPMDDALELLSRVDRGQFVPRDGRLELDDFERAAPLVRRISEAMDAASREVAGVQLEGLIGSVRRAAAPVREQLDRADSAAAALSTAVEVVPGVMGAETPRSILLVVQNNAEVRATAGMPGSFTFLTARGGRIAMGPHYSTSDLPPLARPAMTLSAEERSLFGPTPATDVRDTNLMPDVPRAAQLLSSIVSRATGRRVDSVVLIDAVALARVVRATGPVQAGPERLTAQNLVTKLLHQPYQRFETQEEQNAYFAVVAGAITTSMLTGGGDARELVRSLADSVGQRRLAVWSSHRDEQDRLEETAAAGALPHDPHGAPHVGMYLNDAAGGKLEYYLRTKGNVESVSCGPSRQTVRTRFELRSLVPPGGRGLSKWTTGIAPSSRKGIMRLNLRLYAPTGGILTGLDVNGDRAEVAQGSQLGRPVSILPITLAPGGTVQVMATFDTGPNQQQDPILDWTPGILWGASSATAATTC